MSIPILSQLYDETRRLAIAGSVVAGGDFRLKKLLLPLEQAGAKAPVFARLAEAAKGVVEAKETTSAPALLELATLVSAILYTQGETGASGKLEPIETTDLGAPTSQASARVLKPLLEALTSTGSGRLELIRDAHERGAFRDLRLVKSALEALDDPFGEIGDFVAEKVLPLYGKAILPELRAKLDLKGRGGHPRRLRLMHALDPAGTRETVKQALDDGSKEIKVTAIACLGPDDLSYLLEQAGAKAAEVRAAAYQALARLKDDAAVAALQKALAGKDLDYAAAAMHGCRNAKLHRHVLATVKEELASLPKTKDKKEVSKKVERLNTLLGTLDGHTDTETEEFLLDLFGRRAELAKIKGATYGGQDLNMLVIQLLREGSKKLRATLAAAHAELPAEELGAAFEAARHTLDAAKVFEMFSPYLTAKVDHKKKREPAWVKREALIEAMVPDYYYWSRRGEDQEPPLDPRWLDCAVAIQHLGLIRQLGRPDHAGTQAFLKEAFETAFKKAKNIHDAHEVLAAMVWSGHPEAIDAFVALLEKFGKQQHYTHFMMYLVPDLPKSAIRRLEAIVATLADNVASGLLDAMQQLRDKQ